MYGTINIHEKNEGKKKTFFIMMMEKMTGCSMKGNLREKGVGLMDV